jgi:alcohol dehydrogenase
LLRPGGHALLAGATYPARALNFAGEQIVRGMIRITGVYNYQPADLQQGLQFLSDGVGRFPFASLVGRTFPLHEVQQAFEYAETERPPRVAVRPTAEISEQERA